MSDRTESREVIKRHPTLELLISDLRDSRKRQEIEKGKWVLYSSTPEALTNEELLLK